MTPIRWLRTALLPLWIAQASAQDTGYASKEYDVLIYKHQHAQVTAEHLDKATYLKFTMPFSKWDPRPLTDSVAWMMGERQWVSVVPNFYWGTFAKYYGLSVEEASAMPNDFLKMAYEQEEQRVGMFGKKIDAFVELTEALSRSAHHIHVQQEGLLRVDELYEERGRAWRYVIPDDSPFPMSDSIVAGPSGGYDEIDRDIIRMMKKLGVYASYQNDTAILLLLDGTLDNSCGYVFQRTERPIVTGPLFNIARQTPIGQGYSYFVSR